MQLTRWSLFPELDAMQRPLRHLFDDVGVLSATVPVADVYETDDDYVFELEVPGFEDTQLTVQVSDHTLSIKGEREQAAEQDETTFHLRERFATRFERRFRLPPEVVGDKVFAEYDAGVLSVHAPKGETVEPREVGIVTK